MDSYNRGFYKGASPASIGRITSEYKDEEKPNEEDKKIDEMINQSTWAKNEQAPAVKAPAAPSFTDLFAQEETKKKEKRISRQKSEEKPVDPRVVERPVYSNRPMRAPEAYREDEPEYGEMVYDGATGETTFIPYAKEEGMGRFQDEMDEYGGGRRGYGGGYGGGGYGGGRRHGYRGGYSSNQFYDDGEDDQRRGGRRSERGRSRFYDSPSNFSDRRSAQPKLSAKEKYGDYSKNKMQPLSEGSTPIIQFGVKKQPKPQSLPEPEAQPQPETQPAEGKSFFNPKKQNPNEEEWTPEK
jgi:hypothetical protein